MEKTIPITVSGFDAEELKTILADLSQSNPAVQLRKIEGTGVAMDPGSIAILVKVAELTIPALLGGLFAIWAAYIAKGEKLPSKDTREIIVRVVIETDLDQYIFTIDNFEKQRVEYIIQQSDIPGDIEEITRIYLEVE